MEESLARSSRPHVCVRAEQDVGGRVDCVWGEKKNMVFVKARAQISGTFVSCVGWVGVGLFAAQHGDENVLLLLSMQGQVRGSTMTLSALWGMQWSCSRPSACRHGRSRRNLQYLAANATCRDDIVALGAHRICAKLGISLASTPR